jgi:hypothetical protein
MLELGQCQAPSIGRQALALHPFSFTTTRAASVAGRYANSSAVGVNRRSALEPGEVIAPERSEYNLGAHWFYECVYPSAVGTARGCRLARLPDRPAVGMATLCNDAKTIVFVSPSVSRRFPTCERVRSSGVWHDTACTRASFSVL